MEQSSLERTVHRIPALRSNVAGNKTRLHGRQRVAAYCRVSTEQEEQESSFENQVEYYTNLIRINPDWECAGIFADRGISGTKDTIRPEFMKMIEECKKHKINMRKAACQFEMELAGSLFYI